MKKLLAFLFFSTFSALYATPLSDVVKRAFVDFYRETELFGAFLENQWVTVFFFDIDNDGLEEAIATDYNYQDRFGCSWHVFVQIPQAWERAKRRRVKDNPRTIDPISRLFANTCELYVLTREDLPPQLAVINRHYEKFDVYDELGNWDDFKYVATLTFYTVSIDKEGYLKVEKTKSYLAETQTEELDELYGQGKYTLKPITPVTYTEVPALKPEEKTQLLQLETPQPAALKTQEVVILDGPEPTDVPAPPSHNKKSTTMMKWLAGCVVVVLYVIWRFVSHRYKPQKRHS